MKSLSDFLGKYKKLVSTDRKIGEVIVRIIKEETEIELERNQLKINDWTVFVKASSAIKAEIFLHRQKILDRVKEELGPESPKIIA